MDYSRLIVLLARQRSGTNALRAVWETHPKLFCFNEVFNFGDRKSEQKKLRDANYFNFLERYAKDDVTRIFPDRHETVFNDYLEYLRCFTEKSYMVLDVKYNTSQFFTKPWNDSINIPYLFELLNKYGIKVYHLTRKNYVRYFLSNVKARSTHHFAAGPADKVVDKAMTLDVNKLLFQLKRCKAEDDVIEDFFGGSRNYLSCDYAELFPSSGSASPVELKRFADWIGVSDEFAPSKNFKKQSYLPLDQTISNFDEVKAALQGGEFEYCLEDEPIYTATV